MKQLLGTFVSTIIKVVIIVLIIIGVYKLCNTAYDFGFQIFADIPVATTGDGRTVNVIISDDMDEKDVADLLEEKGLVKNATVFYIQEKLSLSDEELAIVPGTYELNTAMTAEEMLEILTGTADEDTEEEEE